MKELSALSGVKAILKLSYTRPPRPASLSDAGRVASPPWGDDHRDGADSRGGHACESR
jgi:hypothetical protein